MKARAAGIAVLLLFAASASSALAQPSVTAPDLVRLRDGGLLRGTIAELAAGDHVTIVLLTGETRRVAAADFTFAGPVEEAPRIAGTPPTPEIPAAPAIDSAPPPMPTDAASARAGTGGASVRFRGARGARVVVDAASETNGAGQLSPVCTTPCALVMPVGAYYVGLTLRSRCSTPTAADDRAPRPHRG